MGAQQSGAYRCASRDIVYFRVPLGSPMLDGARKVAKPPSGSAVKKRLASLGEGMWRASRIVFVRASRSCYWFLMRNHRASREKWFTYGVRILMFRV